MTEDIILRADYYQVQVLDEESVINLGDFWTKEATTEGIIVAGDALAIVTLTNLHVTVSVEVLQSNPSAPNNDAARVVEGDLYVPSGRVIVMGCMDYLPDAKRFDVGVGWHRVRAVLFNVDKADGDSTIEERLRLCIWPVQRK